MIQLPQTKQESVTIGSVTLSSTRLSIEELLGLLLSIAEDKRFEPLLQSIKPSEACAGADSYVG
jgi:hypothetical protein